MSHDLDSQTSLDDRSGLIAFTSTGTWDITVAESFEENGVWEAEIEGPSIYVSFSFEDARMLGDALDYLTTRISRANQSPSNGITLGKFGESKIMLIWDNEDFDRCFLVVGPTNNSVIRFSLLDHDIKMLTKAFQNVVNQLSDDSKTG